MQDNSVDKNPFAGAFTDLAGLADKIEQVLNCPVTIEDSNHRLLAYSSHDDEADSARIATIIRRRVPEKVINQLWKAGIIPQLNQSDSAVIIPEMKDIGLGNRVAIAIRKNEEVLGYIWLVQHGGNFSNEQLTLLKKAAQSARSELLKLNVNQKKNVGVYEDFFWQLLTGQSISENEIKETFAKMNKEMPKQFAVLVFHFEEEITSLIEEKTLYLITTSQRIKNTFYVSVRNELILIASPTQLSFTMDNIAKFIDFMETELKDRFSIGHVKGSSGSIYSSFDKMEASYQEALQVLHLKNKFPELINNIYHYQDLGVFRYLDVMIEKRKNENIENPTIYKLKQYDTLNRTNFLETLEAYIFNDSNVYATSKELFIHTNTLNYRLKRISEIADIDLRNVHQKMSIYIDLMLKKLDGKKDL